MLFFPSHKLVTNREQLEYKDEKYGKFMEGCLEESDEPVSSSIKNILNSIYKKSMF